jgi:hypothetical protein
MQSIVAVGIDDERTDLVGPEKELVLFKHVEVETPTRYFLHQCSVLAAFAQNMSVTMVDYFKFFCCEQGEIFLSNEFLRFFVGQPLF